MLTELCVGRIQRMIRKEFAAAKHQRSHANIADQAVALCPVVMISGTHKKEMQALAILPKQPSGSWYVQAGSSMGDPPPPPKKVINFWGKKKKKLAPK